MRRTLGAALENNVFKMVMVGVLIFALFGGGVWVLADVPDDPGNSILDFLMMVVMVVFMAEVLMNCFVYTEDYPLSFFFVMDVLGTASMVSEVSILLGSGGKIKESGFLRTARAAKGGAWVGRLFKGMKCLSLFFRGRDQELRNTNSETMEAKVISQRLQVKLSTRISCLVLTLVLLLPFLQIGLYPEADLSLRNWGQRHELDYARAYKELESNPQQNATDTFKEPVSQLVAFYGEVNYYPYKLEGFPERRSFCASHWLSSWR